MNADLKALTLSIFTASYLLETHWKTLGPKTVARLKAVIRFSLWLRSTSVRKWQR